MRLLNDIVFIGAGPATIFSVLKLLEDGYKGNIVIIDKGKPVEERTTVKDILYGWAGAGCKSDCKLSSNAFTVGGNIPNLTQEVYDEFESWLLAQFNKFKIKTSDKQQLVWDKTKLFDTKDSGLIWDTHNCCHIGTDRGVEIFKQIQDYILSQSNIDCLFNCEVEDIKYLPNVEIPNFNIMYKNKDGFDCIMFTKKVVLATGRASLLTPKIISEFFKNNDLETNPFQLGIRVEDTINDVYKQIINATYDFKFYKNYNFGPLSVRVRTFCCNSGNAHTCVEKSTEGFMSFNGHAFKQADPNNNSVNYGIICEITGLHDYDDKNKQIELMKKVNNYTNWKHDNFDDDDVSLEKPNPKRLLLDGFEHLRGIYPDIVIDCLTDFVTRLNKLVDLSKAHYLYPEVKLSSRIPAMNWTTFETNQKGLYIIGDGLNTRGIVKAALEGYLLAKNLD